MEGQTLKMIFTYFFSLFNVGMYMSDRLDSLIMVMRYARLEEQANQVVMFQSITLMIESARLLMMLISLCFLFLIHRQTLADIFKPRWNWFKDQVSIFTTKLKHLNPF